MPKLDGRNMVMVLAPDKKARAAWEKAQAEANGETPPATAATEPAGEAETAAPAGATEPIDTTDTDPTDEHAEPPATPVDETPAPADGA
jgi:hypothetical protein